MPKNRRQACFSGTGREERLTILGCATIVVLVKDGFLLGYREFNTENSSQGDYDGVAEDKDTCQCLFW